jgi:hypothetical protein
MYLLALLLSFLAAASRAGDRDNPFAQMVKPPAKTTSDIDQMLATLRKRYPEIHDEELLLEMAKDRLLRAKVRETELRLERLEKSIRESEDRSKHPDIPKRELPPVRVSTCFP